MVELLGLLLVALVFFIPGVALSFALFTGTVFGKLDRVFAGAVLGITVIPVLLFLESFAGLQLSALLVLANSAVVFVASVALIFLRGYSSLFSHRGISAAIQRQVKEFELNPVKLIVPALLVLIVLLGFYYRIAFTFITNFFEFDPYYYNLLTEMLVRHGSIPLTSDISYFPLSKFHHEPAVVQYLTGAWYVVYNFFTGLGYDKNSLILIANIYPPLVGALLSVLAFWFLRSHYGEIAGIAGALFFAATPTLLQKFAAGVTELQPWGIFSALLIFTTFALALRFKNWQFLALAALAVFAAVNGAVQSMWPVGVMAAFFMLQAIVNYYSGHNERSLALTAGVFSASVLVANLAINAYTGAPLFLFPIGMLIGIFSFMPALVLYVASENKFLSSHSRKKVLAGFLALGILVSFLPVFSGGQSISSIASGYIEVTSAFATYAGPLSRTIAEETPTDPGVLSSVFGVLSPVILLALALMVAWSAVEVLLLKGKWKHAGVFVTASIAVMFLRSSIADFAIEFGSNTGLAIVSTLGKLLGVNELFAFLLVAIASAVVVFVYSTEKDRNEAGLLSILIIYPVAYIGLNKVKFLLHLGFALVLGFGALMGEVIARAKFIHVYFKIGDSHATPAKWTAGFAIVLILILGLVQVAGLSGKAPGVVASTQGLGGSQISQDWLLAMSWLRNNTNYNDPALQAQCVAKYGHDCRVISWWDYGHWTAFLGETKTVLDPGNSFEFLDQEVAYGFVDNETAFKQSVAYHNASHVLVDFQLVQKWGALVFLSGSCQRDASDSSIVKGFTCPDKRQIENWQAGAGQSQYEFMHYFETLNVQGQCPYAQSMILLGSSFGGAYCATDSEVIPIDRSGLRTDLARSYQPVDLRAQTLDIDSEKHYLLPISQTTFVNANPDLRVAGLNSSIINSVFTRLYFFENLPGYRLAYRSPNGEVKIFEKIPV